MLKMLTSTGYGIKETLCFLTFRSDEIIVAHILDKQQLTNAPRNLLVRQKQPEERLCKGTESSDQAVAHGSHDVDVLWAQSVHRSWRRSN
jgi:hypothetical protein